MYCSSFGRWGEFSRSSGLLQVPGENVQRKGNHIVPGSTWSQGSCSMGNSDLIEGKRLCAFFFFFFFLLSWGWSDTGPGTERGCGIFILRDTQNLTGQGLSLISLTLLGVGVTDVPNLIFSVILSKSIIILGEAHISCINLSLCSVLVFH